MDDQTLLFYNQQGLIPGPKEEESEFLKRASYALALKQSISEKLLKDFPFPEIEPAESPIWEEAWQTTKPLYDIAPSWVPLFFSNYQLNFWQGGCAWIFQADEMSPLSAFFQLRQKLRLSPHYLKIYSRNELMVHELSHIGRMKFEEPKFEEIHAYRSSPSSFRQVFGPIVQAPWESALFVLVLFLIIFLDLTVLAIEPSLYLPAMWVKVLPFTLGLLALIRLSIGQRTFKKCLHRLEKTLQSSFKASAVIYRLTDEEIEKFSEMDEEGIRHYGNEQRNKTLRWRLVHMAYFS